MTDEEDCSEEEIFEEERMWFESRVTQRLLKALRDQFSLEEQQLRSLARGLGIEAESTSPMSVAHAAGKTDTFEFIINMIEGTNRTKE